MLFPKTIADALLSSAHWNAREAFEHWDSDDHPKALHASVCLGISAELLLKHLVSLESPALLADLVPKDKVKAFNARLAFADEGYRQELSEVHSCSADDAYFIHKEMKSIPEVVDKKDFALLLKIRNAACHLAAISPYEERRDAVYALLRMFDTASLTESQWSDPFQDFAQEVKQFQERYRQDRFALVMAKVEEVKAQYRGLNEADRNFEAMARGFLYDESELLFGSPEEGWDAITSPAYRSRKCLVCGQTDAEVLYEQEGEVYDVPREADDEAVFEYGNLLHPLAFACDQCGLTLTSRELRALASGSNGWAQGVLEQIEDRSGHYSNGQGPLDT